MQGGNGTVSKLSVGANVRCQEIGELGGYSV